MTDAEIEQSAAGRYARGYRSPSWDLSPHSVELLLAHGFVYDSSMMGDDYTPYRVRDGDVISLQQPAVFGKPTSLIEIPVSWTLDDYPHFEFIRTPTWVLPGLMNADNVLANWIDDSCGSTIARHCDGPARIHLNTNAHWIFSAIRLGS